jgi:beta-galactosidase
MEQSPSQQNWQPYNRLKPPGQLRLQSMQAVAHGADSVMYFQWRRGRGGIEKLHGAVMEHGGTSENRVFKEVGALGAELQDLTEVQGERVPAKVALLFDWPNWWGLSFSSGPSKDLDYVKVVKAFYGALHSLGIQVEVLSPAADLSQYDIIVAPLLTMLREEGAEAIRKRVEDGATLVATCFTGLIDENDRVYLNGAPGPWRELLGIFVEETDALPAGSEVPLEMWEGKSSGSLLADRIRLEGATPLAYYAGEFYAGEPAITENRYGAGTAFYTATLPDHDGLRSLMMAACYPYGIGSPLPGRLSPPEGVEVTQRGNHLFLLNHCKESVEVLVGPEAESIVLAPLDTVVHQRTPDPTSGTEQ